MQTGEEILGHYADGVRVFRASTHPHGSGGAGVELFRGRKTATDRAGRILLPETITWSSTGMPIRVPTSTMGEHEAWSVSPAPDDAGLRGADLRGATFRNMKWLRSDMRGIDFRGCEFVYCRLTGCDLRGANFRNATISNTHIEPQLVHIELWEDDDHPFGHAGVVRVSVAGREYAMVGGRLDDADFRRADMWSSELWGRMKNTDLWFANINLMTERMMSVMALPRGVWALPLSGAIMERRMAARMMTDHSADLSGVELRG